MENREKMEKTGCKIICGTPTTLAVKGLMMMMMKNGLGQAVVAGDMLEPCMVRAILGSVQFSSVL